MRLNSNYQTHHSAPVRGGLCRWLCDGLAIAALLSAPHAIAQAVDFQIVWVVIGEAASGSSNKPARAGRQLFMASDLLRKNMSNEKVERLDVLPQVMEVTVGDKVCINSFDIRALAADQKPLPDAPLSISIRQDQKERLGLQRARRNICVRPSEPGEYPIRLTSLIPATDGTMRGAQVFLRAAMPEGEEQEQERTAQPIE